ncbi:hypothetical protein V492_01524 [Pseudogymnoascus sp. VKM F-4246]|nr:hypothetical protein V492_01524 [Pseudogymnoascus sp. VKM F-4246]
MEHFATAQYPTPESGASVPDRRDYQHGVVHLDNPEAETPKKRQKRNKPTLSCEECVGRKTKCDRGRPHCLACLKRQTECQYDRMANVLEETNRSASDSRRMTIPPKRRLPQQIHNGAHQSSPKIAIHPMERPISQKPLTSPTGALPDVPTSNPEASASNVFGIGSEHPFANYWTCQGGLAEVISVLPEKIQADMLLERYFDIVDCVYPYIHRQTFYADYSHFWSLSTAEKANSDAALIALIFSMLAMGTQFVSAHSSTTKQTAEFYVSAAHQALRMSSYLNKTSIRSIQSMVLIVYFLINDNHASDGWAFAGILIRQAYAMGLHRDPNIVCPQATTFEKQQRRKLWQAVLFQDTFLTVLLSLPPSATHTDVSVADLVDDASSIASSSPTDVAYIRGCWTLANLVQESICSPRSLSLPIASTPRHKSTLLASFRAVYRSFPDQFRCWDPASIAHLARTNKRLVRQTLFLTSNYWHNVMLLHSSESKEVPVNVKGTLEAAHEAISAFFLLVEVFGAEARVWWVFCHRAFLESVCMGHILLEQQRHVDSGGDSGMFARARGDITKMIDIMTNMSEGENGCEVARTRVSALAQYV